MWTDKDTELFREEVERRFRERTPPKDIYDILVEGRVTRSEMRTWAKDNLGKPVPELDLEWMTDFAKWYKRMARRVIKELTSSEHSEQS